MSFLNKYNQTPRIHVYEKTISIGNFLYAIGGTLDSWESPYQSRAGLITKLDINGNVVWQKSYYSLINGKTSKFYSGFKCENNDLLLSDKSEGSGEVTFGISRIDSEGNLLWRKEFKSGAPSPSYRSNSGFIKLSGENYVQHISNVYIDPINELIRHTDNLFIMFDGEGNVFNGITLSSIVGETYGPHNFYINTITSDGNYIVITCSDSIIILDSYLSLVSKFRLKSQNNETTDLTISNACLRGNELLFVCEPSEANNRISYIGKIAMSNGSPVSGGVFTKKFIGRNTMLNFNSDSIFCSSYVTNEEYNNSILKFDNNFNLIWAKEFNNNEVSNVLELDQIDDSNIYFHISNAEYWAYTFLIGKTNLDLECCKTSLISNYEIIDKELFLDTTFNFALNSTAVVVENLSFDVIDYPFDKIEICPTIPVDTCIKDEKICTEYDKLLQSFTKCIEEVKSKNPDYIKKLSVFKDCFKKFLEAFNQIDKNYPQLKLTEYLQFQIKAITVYIEYEGNKGIEKYYYDALSAVQFILEYLSQLGNCNCENVLDLTDYSSIQSGHLYLQSAGSIGKDSTKGIHLRWALRESLSNHLPKANYATTTHNFNKSDDFVKIYRAKYTPYKTTLDFNNIPLQINESSSQKNWIYEIDEKVFHVHFRNNIKYNQVRAIINPSVNPLGFIKNYGDALLEIETKTELSFKISPKFEILNSSNSVKTELLSVSENKITSPKAASLRKKYAAEELNEKPLLSENIRSIRFSSNNAHIILLSFEFYSDCIINTKKENNWKFLGKYALTKEANVAFQRLEPETNCLKKWLRYNDQAFVNVANYHTRWNSTNLPALERISTSVDKYIALSDAFNNPRAIEIFPFENYGDVEACNLTYPDYDPENPEYDPYIPETPTETTGIEIPYLDILQLGSLDYHIARMLGLGTLDLNPLVFEGEYIYLSEYVTFGNLQDGLGARQVQHLYCSLPTSLSDQRLPIPVDLKEPVPGIFFNNGYDDSDVEDNEEEPIDPEQNNFDDVQLTVDGYSADGKTKYYTLYLEPLLDEEANAPFYYSENEFTACETTDPVFAGLEYRKKGTTTWIKPELSYSPDYFNIDTSGIAPEFTNETVELVIPEQGKSLYTHAVKESGELEYSSYGINWFSRATPSEIIHPVKTIIKPTNELLPPTNVTATLIQKESPLLLTSSTEQLLYTDNNNPDKTLVRLTFEYNHAQELIDYHQKINGETIPNYFETHNSKELFAEKIQVHFRDQVPNSVYGKVSAVSNNSNPLLVEIETSEYTFASNNESVIPSIPNGSESNFIGSIMLVDNVEYIVHEVDNSGNYPKFIVFKADASGALLNLNTVLDPDTEILVPGIGSLFMIVENMQNLSVWGLPNTSGFDINIDHTEVHREDEIIIKNIDCNTETHVQKFRGIYKNAIIEKVLEKIDEDEDGEYDTDANDEFILKHLGLYKITFPGFKLPQHLQYHLDTSPHSVEWYNGVVRLHTLSDFNGQRKEFKVIRTENIGSTTDDLILYIEDLTFPSNLNLLSSYKGKLMSEDVNSINQMTNYYPGYKVYLYKDDNLGLNKDTVLPQGEDDVHYTVFGLRSWDFPNEFQNDNTVDFFSKMSVPALMFANAIIEPVQPQKPTGGMYATRPDYFGKASYTFNTKYGTPENIHKPYSVQFNRASDIQFLSAIYKKDVLGYDTETGQPILNTVQKVMQNIFLNGEEDFYVDRWNDLLSFDYPSGLFATYDERTLPLPDNSSFITSINTFIDAHNAFYNNLPTHVEHISVPILNLNEIVIPKVILPGGIVRNEELKIKDFLKDVLLNCFVPLTEVPVMYNFIKPYPYKPIPKKQVIRDRNGNLLKPTLDSDSDFDMAPMMCRIDPQGKQYESQFTDFGLDGASNAKYFYAVREINNQMKTSDYSEILGPISLVNTAPPVAPEIIKVIPVLENRTIGVAPSVQLQINAYPKAQNIAKVSIYRANNPADALSIRTMKLVKVLDLEVENLINESKWIFEDDFSDLTEIPFGDPLFYRLTVSRRIRYNDKELANIVDYAPSEASKLIITNIVENYNPLSPNLDYYSEPLDSNNELTTVILHWEKTCYKGKYHLYKMNSQGNWVKIHELQTNDQDIYLPLEYADQQTGILSILNDENNPVYHHFKVITENTAGMISAEEYILTVHNEANWQDIGGIGDMIVGGTFYIR